MAYIPQYYRTRIALLLKKSKEQTDEMVAKRLLQGFDDPKANISVVPAMKYFAKSNDPLTTKEILTGATWFAMHPNKIAGEQKAMSSLFFPVQVIGTEQDVKDMFSFLYKVPKKQNNGIEKPNITIIKLKAKALKLKQKQLLEL